MNLKVESLFQGAGAERCGGRDRVELWIWGIAYALFSSTLLVANKWALSWVPAPNFLMTLQCVATALFVYVISAVTQRKLRIDLENPFSSELSTLWFVVSVLIQFATIGSNMMSLYLLGVDRVILLRIFAMFPVAIGDWLFNSRHLPSFNTWACFCSLGAAVVFVFGFDKTLVTPQGIAWGIAYFVAITSDQVLLKKFTKAVQMKDSSRTFWMNLLNAPVSGAALFAVGEVKTIISSSVEPNLFISVAVSCFLGAGISFTAWGLRSRSSAVTFALVGIVCKLGSIALNFAFLDHLKFDSIVVIVLSIISTFFYEQALERTCTTKEEDVSFTAVPTSEEDSRQSSHEMRNLPDSVVELETNTAEIGQPTAKLLPSSTPSASSMSQGSQTTSKWQLNFNKKSWFAIGIFVLIVVTGIVQVKFRTNVSEIIELFDDYNATALPLPSDALWSWHRCVGDVVRVAPQWRYKSCHFKNVCYDGNAEGRLTYFSHRLEDVRASDLSSGSMPAYASDSRATVTEYKLDTRRSAINASDVIWAHGRYNDSVVTFVANYFIPGVWTHLVFDNILPMFRLLEIFDMPKAVVEPLWFDFPCKRYYDTACELGGVDSRFNPEWFNIITARMFDVAKLQERYQLIANQTGKLVCFRNVMTGPSILSDHGLGDSEHGRYLDRPDWTMWGTGGVLWRYRLFTMERMGIAEPEKVGPSPSDGFYDVVFLRKGQRSYNSYALDTSPAVSHLFEVLRAENMTHVRIAREVYLENYSIVDQFHLLARAKVVVSQAGSTAYGAFWLPRGATLVIADIGERLDYYLWTQISHVHTKYVPWNEYDTTPIVRAVLAGLTRFDQGHH